VTPTLSEDAVQVTPICVVDEALAAKFAGAVGGVVSDAGELEPQPCNNEIEHDSRARKSEIGRSCGNTLIIFKWTLRRFQSQLLIEHGGGGKGCTAVEDI
jgi:hypothetical protein